MVLAQVVLPPGSPSPQMQTQTHSAKTNNVGTQIIQFQIQVLELLNRDPVSLGLHSDQGAIIQEVAENRKLSQTYKRGPR